MIVGVRSHARYHIIYMGRFHDGGTGEAHVMMFFGNYRGTFTRWAIRG